MGKEPAKKETSRKKIRIRLKGYDYSQAGAYFVTICVQGGISLFGEVVDGAVLNGDDEPMVHLRKNGFQY